MAAGTLCLTSTTTLFEMGVQFVEAGGDRYGHHEVGPRKLHKPLDLALVVALCGPAEAVPKQIVAAQLCEGARPLALPVAADLRHRDLRVVVEDG